jgi:NAD(P)-dependent dehydrogenase (short-subunit alcohol dehydrogenase family)
VAVPDLSNRSLTELLSLDGRVAVVTGAAKGIGRATAARLAEAGAHVLLADLDEDEARAVADELAAHAAGKCLGVALDVADAASITAIADRAMADFGALDIWVNNAGIYPPTPLLLASVEDWDRVLDINLRGAFWGSREAAARMIEGGRGGVIVNVASTAGFRAGGAGLSAYVSSKHGLVGLTKVLAVELGPHGIRALGVAPTLIETPGIEGLKAVAGDEGFDALLADLSARLPLGRPGVADDVARVILFCASDLSLFMTGSTLLVDAGDIAL